MTDTRAKSLGWMAEVITELVNELQATRKELEQEREKQFRDFSNYQKMVCMKCNYHFALKNNQPMWNDRTHFLKCPRCTESYIQYKG